MKLKAQFGCWSVWARATMAPGALFAIFCGMAACSGQSTEPPERTQISEKSNETIGTLRRVAITDIDTGNEGYDFFLEVQGDIWLKLLVQDVADNDVDHRVRVLGPRTGDQIQVQDIEPVGDSEQAGDWESLGSAEGQLLSASPKRVAVILFNHRNAATQPIDMLAARNMVFGATNSSNAYYKEVSYGLRSLVGSASVEGDVYGWYTIDADNTGCDYAAWGSAARAKAQAAGVDLTKYDQIIHYYPRTTNCQFAGVGQVPGKYNWINGSNAQTIAHELGHNFGVHHASSYRCTDNGQPVVIGASCTQDEYGDPFDIMGRGYRHFNAYHKGRLGWLEPENKARAQANGDYSLVPIETKATGLQALQVPIPGSNEFYYVEYRQPFGFDNFNASDPVANGVLIHKALDYTALARTQLIDLVPNTTSFTDAPLGVGRTFADNAHGVSITLLSRDTSRAVVRVTFGSTGGEDAGVDVDSDSASPTDAARDTSNGSDTAVSDAAADTSTPDASEAGPTPGCAIGERELQGHCYALVTTARTFDNARTACRARGTGWDLATIGSAAENSLVSSMIGNVNHWLGGTDRTAEGSWRWVDGTAFFSGGATGTPVSGSYTRWLSGEPNNADNSDCLRMTPGGAWRDITCGSYYPAVCEKSR